MKNKKQLRQCISCGTEFYPDGRDRCQRCGSSDNDFASFDEPAVTACGQPIYGYPAKKKRTSRGVR